MNDVSKVPTAREIAYIRREVLQHKRQHEPGLRPAGRVPEPGPLPVGGQGDRAEERGEGGRPEGDEAARVRQQDRAGRRAGAQHSVSGEQRIIRLS